MSELLADLESQVRPTHSALLIVDLQNDFCAEGGFLHRARKGGANGIRVDENAQIADRIGELADSARRAGVPVVWIRSIYDFKYLADPWKVKRGVEGCCLEGSWGADFFRIRPAPQDIVIDKHAYSAFHQTELESLLRARGVRTLIMSGVATNVCVESTLRDGFFRGFYVVLASDCVGSGNRVGHDGTLSTVQVNFGLVSDRHTLGRLLQSPAAQG